MQHSWRQDADKLTFIACLPSTAEKIIIASQHDDSDRMLGDVNLFLTRSGEEGEEGVVGEIELMIADKISQGKGYGRASLLTFVNYIARHESDILAEYSRGSKKEAKALHCLRVKIGQSNYKSLKLFESVGFCKTADANFFGEIEMRIGSNWRAGMKGFMEKHGLQGYCEIEYTSTGSSAP